VRVRYGGLCRRNLRFIGFRSASEIGIDVFLRESHELLLLSEETIRTQVHRYVQYTQGGGEMWVAMYVQGERERRVELDEGGSHQGAKGSLSQVTCLVGERFVWLD